MTRDELIEQLQRTGEAHDKVEVVTDKGDGYDITTVEKDVDARAIYLCIEA
jgi:hypothetical protein